MVNEVLIVPSGIETKVGARQLIMLFVLIVPSGIETPLLYQFREYLLRINCT